MAVGVVLEFKGATLDQYDQVIEKMNLTPGGPTAPGGLFHWVTKTDDGIRVTDVWETREQFERFSEEQIGLFTAAVGMPAPTSVTFYDVHNYLTADRRRLRYAAASHAPHRSDGRGSGAPRREPGRGFGSAPPLRPVRVESARGGGTPRSGCPVTAWVPRRPGSAACGVRRAPP